MYDQARITAEAHARSGSTIGMCCHPPRETYVPEHHVYDDTSVATSRSLRPEAVEFRPSALDQEHHTSFIDPACGRYALGSWPRYSTPIIADSQHMPMIDVRPATYMPAIQRAANHYRRQRLQPFPINHQGDNGLTRIDQLNFASPSSGCGSPIEGLPQSCAVPVTQVPPINYYEWEHGRAPAEDIQAWTQGAYIPAASHFSTDHLVPPLSSGSVSRQGTASTAGSNGSFYCSSEGCHKYFDKKSSLDHHERNHRVRQHACSVCDKAFVFHKDLRRHEKTHEQERHIFCMNVGCRYHTIGFQRNDHLKRHMQNVHGPPKKSQ